MWVRGGEENTPSSFFSTRSTAPEQPPHDMVMLKLYVCSPAGAATGAEVSTSAIVMCGGGGGGGGGGYRVFG